MSVIVARKIPFDDPQVLDYVRIAYVASQVFALLVYYYASSKVRPDFLYRHAYRSRVSDKGKERPDDAQVWCVSHFYILSCMFYL